MIAEKKYTFTIGIKDIVIVVLLAFLFFDKCTDTANDIYYKKGNYDSLYAKIKSDSISFVALKEKHYNDSLKTVSSERKSDSLTMIKDKYIALYQLSKKTVLAQISEGICDTNYVKEVIYDCDSTIISYKNESAQKDTTIASIKTELEDVKEQLKTSNEMVSTARKILNGQDDDIKALQGELKTVKRKNKLRTALIIIGDVVKDALIIISLKK